MDDPRRPVMAVVGVGLIGGSIALAARERLGADVRGWDPAAGALAAAVERGALTAACGSAAEAVAGADVAFVAAPVSELPAAVAEVLGAAGEECVVSDVGSTKRSVVAAVDDPRFVGGHPLAGAETAGVEHARADLFEGATWYLTPTARTGGILYERLHRLLVDLGARPAAVDADTHDALLATVSHLPHVLANVLVARAARVLSDEGERLPATGPSFRDATRVAGANTAIWRDIYLANADALVDAIDDTMRRLSQVRGALAARDGAAVAAWNDGARAERRRLLEADLAGGEVHELRVAVPNRPGRGGRGRARARARGRQHRRHGALPGLRHVVRHDRAVGRRRRAGGRGAGARRGARADCGAPVNARFAPDGPLRGTLAAPPDKSLSHRAALLAAMSDKPVTITGYLDAADTNSTLAAVQSLGALVERREGSLVVRGAGLRGAAPAAQPIDVGNAGTLMRLLPGWLAGQTDGRWTLDGDASIRRRPVDRIATPLKLMGARIDARDGRFPPFTVAGGPLAGIEYELPVASAQVKSCVLLAGLLASGATTVVEPQPSRDHTERMLAAAGVRVERAGARVTVAAQDELELGALHVPGDPSSAAFHAAAAVLVPRSRIVIEGMGANWTRTGFFRILRRMGGVAVGPLEEPAEGVPAAEPVCELDVRHGPLAGTVVEPEEVPLAIDELPLVALLGCFAEGSTVVRGAAELRVKESDRIATVVDGLRALGGRIEATEDGFAVEGTGGLRGGVLEAHGDHRLAMLGAVAGLASREGVEVVGMEAAAVSYPGFEADLAALRG